MRSRSAILFAMLAALTLFLFLLDLAVGGFDGRRLPAGDGENYTEYPTD